MVTRQEREEVDAQNKAYQRSKPPELNPCPDRWNNPVAWVLIPAVLIQILAGSSAVYPGWMIGATGGFLSWAVWFANTGGGDIL